jgi:hypothetical protein
MMAIESSQGSVVILSENTVPHPHAVRETDSAIHPTAPQHEADTQRQRRVIFLL